MKPALQPIAKPPARNRLAVACAAAALLWCARQYCAGPAGDGLFWTTAVLSAAALALPRSIPGTTRWVIWLSLILTVVCMAANVERLTPAKSDYAQFYVLDRVVTAAFASIGVSALFFRMSAVGVTKVLLGALPMTMLAVSRLPELPPEQRSSEALIIWGLCGLIALLELTRQAGAHREDGSLRPGWREHGARGLWLSLVLGLAMLLHNPVERTTLDLQRRLLGLTYRRHWDRSPWRDSELPLWRSLPDGFGDRMRLLLLIRATQPPGYLREGVFKVYERGRWLTPDTGVPLDPLQADIEARTEITRYPLTLTPTAAIERLSFDVLAPRLFTAITLPGDAIMLRCGGDAPLRNAEGMIRGETDLPVRYEADVANTAYGASAYPGPDGLTDPAYRAIPPHLTAAVSNWVARCPGLLAADTPQAAAACIENDFAVRFRYRTDVRLATHPDPLVHFMDQREGFCIHFASAAALMLRLRGIPTRLVGGYVSSEWAPWLNRWVVREREGHAWVEAWDREAREWFLVEATPSDGLPNLHRRPGLIQRLQDIVTASWKQLVAQVENANVLQVIADAGANVVILIGAALRTPWGLLLVSAGGVAAIIWRRHRRRNRQPTRAERRRAELTEALNRLIRRTVPAHLHRQPSETWDEWLTRLAPERSPEQHAALRDRVERYQRIRYRARLDEQAAQDWMDRA